MRFAVNHFPARRLPAVLRGFPPAARNAAAAGLLFWAAASCSRATPDLSSAASTHSAQSLVMMLTQVALQPEPTVSPSAAALTAAPAASRAASSATATASGSTTAIPTVVFTTPTAHPIRATYPGPTPTTNGTSLITATITDRCNAAYYEGPAGILDFGEVKANATFTWTWVLKNIGTCTWYPSYFLYYFSGAQLKGPDIVDFPEIIPPNRVLFLAVTLVAPRQTGKYTGRWFLKDQDFHQFGIGPTFSDPLLVHITVVE